MFGEPGSPPVTRLSNVAFSAKIASKAIDKARKSKRKIISNAEDVLPGSNEGSDVGDEKADVATWSRSRKGSG